MGCLETYRTIIQPPCGCKLVEPGKSKPIYQESMQGIKQAWEDYIAKTIWTRNSIQWSIYRKIKLGKLSTQLKPWLELHNEIGNKNLHPESIHEAKLFCRRWRKQQLEEEPNHDPNQSDKHCKHQGKARVAFPISSFLQYFLQVRKVETKWKVARCWWII